MNFVEERVLKDCTVRPGDVLALDAFLNHQMDLEFLDEIGREIARRFAGKPITRVLTIESSGIAVACAVARELCVPAVVAKKKKTMRLGDDLYVAEVLSFNHKNINTIVVSKKYLNEGDNVLIVDDIMANGCAMQGLISIVDAAGAEVVGCGIVIEKGFQIGGAAVSQKHAGFVVNFDNATANDVLAVIEYVQKTVYEKFGVGLEPEVKFIGIN